VTTRRDQETRPAPDLVDRSFTAERPNQPWAADITFIPSATGLLDLAVVLAAWSRKIVGWAMAHHLKAELVLAALEMAVGQRRPKDVIHHADQGSQDTSLAFGSRGREAGARPSRGSVGDACDNAMRASFLATLGCELLARRRLASQLEARVAVLSHIESWCNPLRLHAALGCRSPANHEQEHARTAALAAWPCKPSPSPLDRGKPNGPRRCKAGSSAFGGGRSLRRGWPQLRAALLPCLEDARPSR
jgi:putative transposase